MRILLLWSLMRFGVWGVRACSMFNLFHLMGRHWTLWRFIGIMIEHYAGEFPLWLSPIHAVVLPITDSHLSYGEAVFREFREAGLRVELDDRNEKIGYKIRDWETKKVPYMLVVGEKEAANGTVSVRQHKKGDLGPMKREEFLSKALEAIRRKSLTL